MNTIETKDGGNIPIVPRPNFPDFNEGEEVSSPARSFGRTQTITGGVLFCIILALAGKCGVDNNIFPNPSVNPAKDNKGADDLHLELQQFLNAGFNGQAVGPEGQNIAPLLEESEFVHSIRNTPTPFGRVIVPEGAKTRWLTAIDKLYPDDSEDLTTLDRTQWKAPCDIVGPSPVVVTTVQKRADGTSVVTDWIEQIADKGHKFIAITNTISGSQEQIVSFDGKAPPFCEAPVQEPAASK